MNVRARFNGALCRTALLGVLAYCLGDTPPRVGLALLASVVIGVAWWTGRKGKAPFCLPRIGVNMLVLGALLRAAAGALGATGQPLVSELAELLVIILTVKLFDRRTPRDEAQVLTMSIFLSIGAILTSVSMLVGALLLAFCVSCVMATMLFHVNAGLIRASAGRGWAQDTGDPDRDGRASRDEPPAGALSDADGAPRFMRHFRALAGVSIVGVMALSAVAFVLTPRGLFQDVLGEFGRVAGTQIGYRGEVSLGVGGGGRLGEGSSRPVLDLEVLDESGQNVGNEGLAWHLRGSTQIAYDRGAWSNATGTVAPEEATQLYASPGWTALSGVEPGPGRRAIREFRITMHEDPGGLPMFSPWLPLEVYTERRTGMTVQKDMTLQASAPSYRIRATLNGAGVRTSDDTQYTQAFSPKIAELAEQILADVRLPARAFERTDTEQRLAARAIERYLQRTYQYTLDLAAPRDGEDQIEMFLFRTLRGHCEYFASAMVALCQSSDMPARIVSGYLASEFNRSTGRYVVRESQAHAWVEVELTPGHWVEFDPSPAADIAALHRPELGVFGRLKRWYESLQTRWAVSVIGFNRDRQRELLGLEEAGGPAEDPRPLHALARSIRRLLSGEGDTQGLGVVRTLSTLLLAGVVVALIVRAVRRRLRGQGPARRAIEVPRGAEFYSDLLRVLDRAGIPKPDASPLRSHLRANAARLAGHVPATEHLAGVYYRARFGGRPPTDAERRDAERTVRELDAALRSQG